MDPVMWFRLFPVFGAILHEDIVDWYFHSDGHVTNNYLSALCQCELCKRWGNSVWWVRRALKHVQYACNLWHLLQFLARIQNRVLRGVRRALCESDSQLIGLVDDDESRSRFKADFSFILLGFDVDRELLEWFQWCQCRSHPDGQPILPTNQDGSNLSSGDLPLWETADTGFVLRGLSTLQGGNRQFKNCGLFCQ